MKTSAAVWVKRYGRTVFLSCLVMLAAMPIAAQPREIRPLTGEELQALDVDKRDAPKVVGPLRDVLPSPPGSPRLARERVPLALERVGLIPVSVYTSTPEEALALLSSLSRPTAHVIGNVIEVYVAPGEVPQLSALPSVLRLTLIEPPQPQAVASYGATVSQGRAVHNASNWIAGGYTGAGVKVGVIDEFRGISTAIAAGEVPTPVAQRCYTGISTFSVSINSCNTESSVHGTAVAESLMDIAPGALLYLASPMSPGDLKQAVEWMISQGVKVINMSQTWLWDGYGDGTSPNANSPLNTVNTAVAAGVVFVISGGNQRQGSYLGLYSDLDSDGWVEFAGTTGRETIELYRTAGETINLQLRWDGIWGTGGTPGTTRDLDLGLWHSSGALVAQSTSAQSGTEGSIPWERILYTVPVTGFYYIKVKKFSGVSPIWFQLTEWEGVFGVSVAEYTDAGGIGSPAESASSGALAVGAAPHNSTASIEPFSSRGPLPNVVGNVVTIDRIKPDIVGADRADTTAYGAGAFAGTSQSAPHVAGLAALVRGAFPSYTPQQVVTYLKSSAQARGTVPNSTWGYGFARLPNLCTAPTLSLASASVVAAGGTVNVGVTAGTGCPWSVSTSAGWLSASPTSGTGNGTVTLAAAATTSALSRTATATIAGQTVTVTQAAGAATFTISPMTWSPPAVGGTQALAVTASYADTTWTATSSTAWLSLSTSSGTGNGTVTLAAAATTSALSRTATATIAGQTVTVTQAAGIPTFMVSTTAWSPTAIGGTQTVAVTSTLADATWSASSTASWLTLSATSGMGSGSVTLTASTNSSATARSAVATIAGQTVTVTQAAADRPLGLRVASIIGNTVTLQWQWPGPAPDRYVLKGGLAPGQTVATLPIGSRAPAFTFDAPTGTFYVRIAGVRGGAELATSDDVRIVVNVPERPSAPTQLLGLANGSGLALSWTNTADGGAATGLVLDVSGALSASLPLALTDQFSFTGVPPGTYTFRVRATNAQGASAASNAVTLSFPGACAAPAVPQDLEAFVVGNVVTIRWQAPASGAAATGYVLNVSGAVSLALPVTGRTLSSPAPPGTYSFTVAAQNACGTSAATSAQTVTIP